MASRPQSVEELLGDNNGAAVSSKPKFLSKSERSKLARAKAEQEQAKKSTKKPIKNRTKRISFEDEESQEETKSSQAPQKKLKANKFNFEWNEDEDTSNGYQPLLEIGNNDDLNFDITSEKHWSQKSLDQMTSRDWRIFREDYNITSKGGDIDNPLRSWQESSIPAKLLKILVKDLGYEEPTPIQRASIPLALNQRDVVGIAETGSGKTMAFLVPLLSYILSIDTNYLEYEHQQDSNYNKPLGLILAPTRELSLQIAKEAQKFCELLGLNVVSIIGGHKYEETVHSVENGVHIVVATPGRLVDSLERNIIGLNKCYYLVMDEADRMIDMGFEKSLQTILDYLPTTQQLNTTIDSRIFHLKKRQTLMFTATLSPPIESITKKYLIKPGYLFIGGAGEAVDHIEQEFEYLGSATIDEDGGDDATRFDKLVKVLNNHAKVTQGAYSIIIFANFKRICDTLSYRLTNQGYRDNVVVHGSKSQQAREQAIEKFRSNSAKILIATDVAARGIDVPNVSLVVNFQMPNKFDEYVHRIGRTGRAGNSGQSFSFVDESDSDLLPNLKKFLVKGRKRLPDWLYKHSSTQSNLLKE